MKQEHIAEMSFRQEFLYANESFAGCGRNNIEAM